MNTTFKNAQPLPLLTNSLVAAYPPSAVWPGLRPGQRKATVSARRTVERTESRKCSVLLRGERETAGEKIAFGLLALSALACLAQAFGTMSALASNWELFNTWVARLLG